MSYLVDVYSPFQIKVKRAKGIYIYDEKDNEYIDTFLGIGVCILGHNNSKVISAMKKKLQRYTHLSNYFLDEDAEFIAQRLVKETGKEGKVFFTNSGAESTETALKAIMKVRKEGKIISFERNFHGRTVKSLSITGFPEIREQFFKSETIFLDFNDANSFEKILKKEKISAVFVETVQGSGGLNVVSKDMAKVINEYKERYGYIVVADEVQAGLGRTGTFYAYKQISLEPDIVTVAKGSGGGLPLGACVLIGKYKDVFKKGEHGTTFAPNPVALAGGRAVLEQIDDKLLESVRKKGEYFRKRISHLGPVKGLGLMVGLNVGREISKEEGLQENLLLNVVGKTTLRFLLPLNVRYSEIDEIIKRLENLLSKKG